MTANGKLWHDFCLAFVKGFATVGIAAAVGLLSLHTYSDIGSFALAGFCAALAGGLAAVQVFVPAISVRAYLPEPWGSAIDSGLHAGLALFITMTTGWLNSGNFSAWHAFITSVVVAVGSAFLRAVQGAVFPQTAGPAIGPHPRRRARGAQTTGVLLEAA